MKDILIGIDVGGTYTDGVLFSAGAVLSSVKRPTDEDDLESTLLGVLDDLIVHTRAEDVHRVVLSTTLVTNLLATGRGERTALILMPGRGLPFSAYRISPDTWFLKGGIDFRGREIEKPDTKEIEKTIHEIHGAGIERIAVAGKFSNRNDAHERMVRDAARSLYPHMDVCTSNEISGRLNYPRRAVTCYYTAMTVREWNRFADAMETAIRMRVPNGDLHILKADGGTTTIEASRSRPCETVFSGPAASTMGTMALSRESLNAVSLDIGGTTTDISLLIEGRPLYASQGARISGHLTHIHSFAVDSLALGGDSVVYIEGDNLMVGPMRLGPAACFGGEAPTVTDAFNILDNRGLGDVDTSRARLGVIAERLGVSLEDLCRRVADIVVAALEAHIEQMFHLWEDEPAYKVWEVINRRKFQLHQVIGIGAAAPAIVPALGKKMGVDHFLHKYTPVANALGAAIARPTLAVEVHVDTARKVYTAAPGGLTGTVDKRNFQLEDAKDIARDCLKRISAERGLADYADESDFFLEEQFNVIRGWSQEGKLFDIGIQVAPGFIHEYKGVED